MILRYILLSINQDLSYQKIEERDLNEQVEATSQQRNPEINFIAQQLGTQGMQVAGKPDVKFLALQSKTNNRTSPRVAYQPALQPPQISVTSLPINKVQILQNQNNVLQKLELNIQNERLREQQLIFDQVMSPQPFSSKQRQNDNEFDQLLQREKGQTMPISLKIKMLRDADNDRLAPFQVFSFLKNDNTFKTPSQISKSLKPFQARLDLPEDPKRVQVNASYSHNPQFAKNHLRTSYGSENPTNFFVSANNSPSHNLQKGPRYHNNTEIQNFYDYVNYDPRSQSTKPDRKNLSPLRTNYMPKLTEFNNFGETPIHQHVTTGQSNASPQSTHIYPERGNVTPESVFKLTPLTQKRMQIRLPEIDQKSPIGQDKIQLSQPTQQNTQEDIHYDMNGGLKSNSQTRASQQDKFFMTQNGDNPFFDNKNSSNNIEEKQNQQKKEANKQKGLLKRLQNAQNDDNISVEEKQFKPNDQYKQANLNHKNTFRKNFHKNTKTSEEPKNEFKFRQRLSSVESNNPSLTQYGYAAENSGDNNDSEEQRNNRLKRERINTQQIEPALVTKSDRYSILKTNQGIQLDTEYSKYNQQKKDVPFGTNERNHIKTYSKQHNQSNSTFREHYQDIKYTQEKSQTFRSEVSNENLTQENNSQTPKYQNQFDFHTNNGSQNNNRFVNTSQNTEGSQIFYIPSEPNISAKSDGYSGYQTQEIGGTVQQDSNQTYSNGNITAENTQNNGTEIRQSIASNTVGGSQSVINQTNEHGNRTQDQKTISSINPNNQTINRSNATVNQNTKEIQNTHEALITKEQETIQQVEPIIKEIRTINDPVQENLATFNSSGKEQGDLLTPNQVPRNVIEDSNKSQLLIENNDFKGSTNAQNKQYNSLIDMELGAMTIKRVKSEQISQEEQDKVTQNPFQMLDRQVIFENERLRKDRKQIEIERDLANLELQIYKKELQILNEEKAKEQPVMDPKLKLEYLEKELQQLRQDKEEKQFVLQNQFQNRDIAFDDDVSQQRPVSRQTDEAKAGEQKSNVAILNPPTIEQLKSPSMNDLPNVNASGKQSSSSNAEILQLKEVENDPVHNQPLAEENSKHNMKPGSSSQRIQKALEKDNISLSSVQAVNDGDQLSYIEDFVEQFEEFYEQEKVSRGTILVQRIQQSKEPEAIKKQQAFDAQVMSDLFVFDSDDNYEIQQNSNLAPSPDLWVDQFQFITQNFANDPQFSSIMLYGLKQSQTSSQISASVLDGNNQSKFDWDLSRVIRTDEIFVQNQQFNSSCAVMIMGAEEEISQLIFKISPIDPEHESFQKLLKDIHISTMFNRRKNQALIPTPKILNEKTLISYKKENPSNWGLVQELEFFVPIRDIIEQRFQNSFTTYTEEELLFIFASLLKCMSQLSRQNIVHGNLNLNSICFCIQTQSYQLINFNKSSHNRFIDLSQFQQTNEDPVFYAPETILIEPQVPNSLNVSTVNGVPKQLTNSQIIQNSIDNNQQKKKISESTSSSWDLVSQDMYSLGLCFLTIKYLIRSQNQLRKEDFVHQMKLAQNDNKTLSSIIITQLMNGEFSKRKLFSYEEILMQKIKGKTIQMPNEEPFLQRVLLSPDVSDYEFKMKKHIIFAEIYLHTFQTENALIEYRMLLYQQMESLPNKFNGEILQTLYQISKCLLLMGDYEEVVSATQQYIHISKILKHSVSIELSKIYNISGKAQWELDDKLQAIEDFQEAINIQSLILGQSHPEVVKGYNNVGVYYNNLNQNDKAIECLLKCIEFGKQSTVRNEDILVSSLYNVGNLYVEQNDFSNSIFYLQDCFYLAINKKESEQFIDMPALCHNLGSIYFKQKDETKSIFYLKQCIAQSKDKYEIFQPEFLQHVQSFCFACYTFGHQNEAIMNAKLYSDQLFQYIQNQNTNPNDLFLAYNALCEISLLYWKMNLFKEALANNQNLLNIAQQEDRLPEKQKEAILKSLQEIHLLITAPDQDNAVTIQK